MHFMQNPVEELSNIDYSTDPNMVSTDYNELFEDLEGIHE